MKLIVRATLGYIGLTAAAFSLWSMYVMTDVMEGDSLHYSDYPLYSYFSFFITAFLISLIAFRAFLKTMKES